jgi:uncharacterized protein YbcI
MAIAEQVPLKGGELNQALGSAVVGIYRVYLGRGPSSASTFHNDDVVVVVVRGVMSHAEKTLAHSGSGDDVTNMRQLLQQTMEADFRSAVERLTGRGVIAFISGDHVDPDIAVETFVLDGPI